MNKRSPILMAIAAALSFLSLSCSSTAKHPAGLAAGTLSPCPDSPNCVLSEQEDSSAYIKPLAFSLPPEQAWQALKLSIQSMGGTIEQAEDNYLWATFRSTIMRFVDDVECRLDSEQSIIHLRSASRVGHSDFGVNRKRMEKLRQIFAREIEQATQDESKTN